MSADPVVVSTDDDAEPVAKKIADKHHNHLPVVDGDGPFRRHGHAGRRAGRARRRVGMERALARIDLGAVERNCARLKADPGGGGRALRGGQGRRLRPRRRRLRDGGARRRRDAARGRDRRPRPREVGRRFPHVPLLTMGALTEEELDAALAAGSEVALWREDFRALAADRARAQGRPARVHVKYDSGMGRLGNRDPEEVLALLRACDDDPDLELAGVWTHFATADEPDSDFFDEQLERFEAVAAAVRAEFPDVTVHAANSAAVFREPALALRHGALRGRRLRARPVPGRSRRARPGRRRSRCAPTSPTSSASRPGTRPATAGPGGREAETWVGVLPLGYGDGVRRGLSNNAEVLIRGRRHPLVGTVSMDNVTIDLGPRPTSSRATRRS